jgi:hypothetical protein
MLRICPESMPQRYRQSPEEPPDPPSGATGGLVAVAAGVVPKIGLHAWHHSVTVAVGIPPRNFAAVSVTALA